MLILSAVLFFVGVFGFFTRRNLVSLLICTELMLNAVDINFAVFNVADAFVCVGVGLMCLALILEARAEAKKKAAAEATPQEDENDDPSADR
mgnify:CR=1 FL=1